MEEPHRRKSWVDMLEDDGAKPKTEIKTEPLDRDITAEPSRLDVPMDTEPAKVKTEPLESPMDTEDFEDCPVRVKQEGTESEEGTSLEGAESGWSKLVQTTEENKPLTPGRLTFAQICAKTSNSPVVSVKTEPEEKSEPASPEKRDRKRSLFQNGAKEQESFGILDEQSMDSPCKDIREIMTNIHMDSPIKEEKQDENEDITTTRRTSPRKAILLKSRDLREALRSPNKGDSSRKRTRETSKGQDSPANKIPNVSTSRTSKTASPKVRAPKLQFETDKETLARRQKQIEYGKNTLGYQRYTKMVPKDSREKRHPKTPPRHLRYSRRAWDGLVKVWRQKLHFWDPPKDGEETPTELPASWDNLSDYSASMSDTASERSESIPNTPQSERKSKRHTKSATKNRRERSLSDSEVEGKDSIAAK
ncbi:hypothetical protein ONE63_003008 [Megalurothrips usitatus]|uniref:Histone RNA hairpin-binding protein RNA-binding domain-containing protein n=1 Tax=Megalurothrips usitatus TaxID=439358 RepID=A0AAV7XAE4_9NEOP|nr:hypothetical protein ONE63_003008 [Megalurothrips usitatus]